LVHAGRDADMNLAIEGSWHYAFTLYQYTTVHNSSPVLMPDSIEHRRFPEGFFSLDQCACDATHSFIRNFVVQPHHLE
jgi:hypothetical protein